jgi:hypothetical protein
MLYSTGASATASPEDDFVLVETAESIASQASCAAALLREHATAPGSSPVDQQQGASAAGLCSADMW